MSSGAVQGQAGATGSAEQAVGGGPPSGRGQIRGLRDRRETPSKRQRTARTVEQAFDEHAADDIC